MDVILNIGLSALGISLVLWISKSNPSLAGFVASLPLSTLIILAFSRLQGAETQSTYTLAKSIFIGIPSTLVFFVPFLLADRLRLSFWTCYFSGFALLGLGFFVHRFFIGLLTK